MLGLEDVDNRVSRLELVLDPELGLTERMRAEREREQGQKELCQRERERAWTEQELERGSERAVYHRQRARERE